MKSRISANIFLGLLILSLSVFFINRILRVYAIGQKIDNLNGVYVHYNGSMNNDWGRHVTKDGYNLGKKWQCVEFVKRYYYEHLNHIMPDSYGHAKDFYAPQLKDGQKNKARNLTQYQNPSQTKPKADDIVVFGGTVNNRYGHVAIISDVRENKIEVIQQNVGKTTRDIFTLENRNGKWFISNILVIGWLRKGE